MARGPQSIGNLLAELMARQGYARLQSARAYETAWREVAGPVLAPYTRIGALQRGTLEVIVANSTLMQELTFQRSTLLKALTERLPNEGIKNLRFRVGSIE